MDTGDFGLVRLMVTQPERALALLKDQDRVVSGTEVLCVPVPDRPGGLVETALRPLAAAGVNVEYLYDFSRRPNDRAVIVLKPDDLERAEKILSSRRSGEGE
jgi:hypothetical protein